MNIKFTLKNGFNEIVYCVIQEDKDTKEEFEKVFSVRAGYGFSVECNKNIIKLIDYFSGETRASFDILKKEKTTAELQYFFKRV